MELDTVFLPVGLRLESIVVPPFMWERSLKKLFLFEFDFKLSLLATGGAPKEAVFLW